MTVLLLPCCRVTVFWGDLFRTVDDIDHLGHFQSPNQVQELAPPPTQNSREFIEFENEHIRNKDFVTLSLLQSYCVVGR